MYFSLLRKMVVKHFVASGLADEYNLRIRYFYNEVHIRSDRWVNGIVLRLYQASWSHFGADLIFYYRNKEVDMFYSLDSYPTMNKNGFFCNQCLERTYFNSIEDLVYDELFKRIIKEIKSGEYERSVEFGKYSAMFVNEENENE